MKHWIGLGIKYLCFGVSWGCTILVFSCLLAYWFDQETLELLMKDFGRQAAGAILTGVACGGTAVVYQTKRLPPLVKVLLHFGVGMGVFFPTALYLNWIPFHPGQTLYTVLQFLLSCGIFAGIWLCFYLFNRSDVRKINDRLRELEREYPEDAPRG
ncbi:MAG: DUF3021 domain-containing protein [Lachnospiraceae bacterium]|nr:DUF3021 domain-containing protein [Lachnospiraceae bacterium]